MARCVAIANQKGGVGKTTTAVNLAASLARLGERVLLVDLDAQGNASTHLGRPSKTNGYTSVRLFEQSGGPVHAAETSIPNLSLIPADMGLASVDLDLASDPGRATHLQAALVESAHEGWTILDCPPSLGLITLNALIAAETVLVPLQCEFLALEGLAHLTRTIEAVRVSYNPRLALAGILLTMFDRRNSLSELVAADVRAFFPGDVLQTVIPRNVKLSEAPSHGLPICLYDPRSPGAVAYERLATEMLERLSPTVAHA